MSEAPGLTVVIPAYNEEARLLATVERIEAWLEAAHRGWEMLIVDDGSTDGTLGLAREWAAARTAVDVLTLPVNRGKGAAVRLGMTRSRGDRVLFSDADLSTPIEELIAMEQRFEEGVDLVLASRGLRESRIEIRQAWYRERMGKTFNLIVRLATGIPFRDTQCGFKLLGGEAARSLAADMAEDGFAFDIELILLANRRGMTIVELPVTWRNDAGSRVDPVTDSWNMLRALPRILGRTGRYRSTRPERGAPRVA